MEFGEQLRWHEVILELLALPSFSPRSALPQAGLRGWNSGRGENRLRWCEFLPLPDGGARRCSEAGPVRVREKPMRLYLYPMARELISPQSVNRGPAISGGGLQQPRVGSDSMKVTDALGPRVSDCTRAREGVSGGTHPPVREWSDACPTVNGTRTRFSETGRDVGMGKLGQGCAR